MHPKSITILIPDAMIVEVITIDVQPSPSTDLPDLHPDDAMINAIAQYVLENNHAPYKDVI